jgi:hypothetical protein
LRHRVSAEPRDLVDVALHVDPSELTVSQRRSFKISIAATNRADATVDPELHHVRLLVNGRQSKAWSLAIGNGKREPRWFALPPGETVSMTWSSLGESLLTGPGEFSLALLANGRKSAPVLVRVRPARRAGAG